MIVAKTICRIIQLCQGKLILARRAARCSGQVSMVRALSAADRVVHPRNPRSRRPPHPHHTCGSSCDVLLVSGDADHASTCAQQQLCVIKKKVVRKDPLERSRLRDPCESVFPGLASPLPLADHRVSRAQELQGSKLIMCLRSSAQGAASRLTLRGV